MYSKDLLTIGSIVIDTINGIKTYGGAAPNVAVDANSLGLLSGVITTLAYEKDSDAYQHYLESMGITVHGISNKLLELPKCNIEPNSDGKSKSGKWFDNGSNDAYKRSIVNTKVLNKYSHIYLAICERSYALKVLNKLKLDQTLILNSGSQIIDGLSEFKQLQERADFIFLNSIEYAYLKKEKYVSKPEELLIKPNQIVAITSGEKDTIIIAPSGIFYVPTENIKAVDETGAGDAFAATFLWGSTQNLALNVCGQLGNLMASYVVTQIGSHVSKEIASKFIAESRKRRLIK